MIDSNVNNSWNEARRTELGHLKVLLEDRLFHYEATLAQKNNNDVVRTDRYENGEAGSKGDQR